jgi:hypothetical protein
VYCRRCAARDADEGLNGHRAVADVRIQRNIARAHVHHAGRDELAQPLVEIREVEERRHRLRIAVAEVLLRDLERIHVLALGAAEVVEGVAAVRRLLEERHLLQVEEAVRAPAHRKRAVVVLRGGLVIVLRRADCAEAGEGHDEAARGDALRRLEELQRLGVARRGGGIVAELVLRRTEVVVGDR